MPEPLEQQLVFDISPALSAIQEVDAALSAVVEGFSAGLTAAVETLSAAQLTVDTSQLAADVQDAIAAITAPVAIDSDTTELEAGIAAATEPQTVLVEGDIGNLEAEIQAVAEPVSISVEGDAQALSDAIETATTDVPPVEIDADTAAAAAAVEALTAEPIEVPVEIEVGDAQDQIEELSQTAQDASGGVESLSGGVEVLSASAGIATGHTGELATGIASIGVKSAAAVSGVVAIGGFIAEITSLAADAEAQTRRFDTTFGDLAEQVRNFDAFSGVADSIEDLGAKSGTTNADLEATASRIGALGKSSQASDASIVGTTQKLLALGATISVNNPRLGDAAEVTDKLTAALARGGPKLAAYGITLSSLAIIEEAKIETGKNDAAQLTQYEKAQAGATLAVKQFGGALGDEFATGSQNAQIQLRALKVQLEETLARVGGPLLTPLLESLNALTPVAQELGVVLGELGLVVVDLLAVAAPALGALSGPLSLVADGLHVVASAVEFLPSPVTLAIAAVGLLASTLAVALVPALAGTIPTLASFGAALNFALGPIGLTIIALGALGAIANEFSGHSTAVADATVVFNDALFGSGAGADTLGGQLAVLDENLKTTLADFITSQEAGSAFREALDGVGGGVDGLASALSGTAEQFDSYRDAVVAAAFETGDFFDAVEAGKGLDTQREALRASEEQQLANLVSTNQLKQSEVDLIKTHHLFEDGTVDLTGSLKAAEVAASKHAAAVQATTHETALAEGTYADLAKAIKAGSTTAEDAASVAEQLGISEAEATTVIQDQLDAITAQNDKRLEATAAAQTLRAELEAGTITAAAAEIGFLGLGISLDGTKELLGDAAEAAKEHAAALQEDRDATVLAGAAAERIRDQLASGRISTDEAEAAFRRLGVSLEGTKKEIEDTAKVVDDFVNKALSNLPQSADAAQQWQQDVSGAFETLSSGVTEHTDHIKEDLASLTRSADPRRFSEILNKQTLDILQFQTDVRSLVEGGFGQLAGFIAQQDFDVAGPLAAAMAAAPGDARIAQAALQIGVTVGDDVDANLRALFPQLQLTGVGMGTAATGGIVQGVDQGTAAVGAAGERAAVAVSARFKPDFTAASSAAVVGAERALAADTTVSQAAGVVGVRALLAWTAAFGPVPVDQAVKFALAAARAAVDTDTSVPGAVSTLGAKTTEQFKPDFVTPTQAAIGSVATTVDASPEVAAATRRLAEGGAAAFNPDLATTATAAIGRAASGMTADTTIATGAAAQGEKATDEYGKNLALSAKTAQAMSEAGLTISDSIVVLTSAAILGLAVADNFVTGIVNGLGNQTNIEKVRNAAAALVAVIPSRARQVLEATSPSRVAIRIGGDFVKGVVVGLSDTTAIGGATADLATTIVTASSSALTAVGPQIVSSVIAGFNDPASIAAGIARLQELIRAASATAAADSFATSATSALPTVGSQISDFASGITSATSALTAAQTAYQKASNDAVLSQGELSHLLEREVNARARLNAAVRKAFEDAAAGAPQAVIDTDVAAVQAAQRNLSSVEGLLKTARGHVADDAAALAAAGTTLRAARAALADASDPATFIENLNRQTRAARAFQADIDRLARAGFTDLAAALSEQGPETAGKLADSLANSPARARQAEAAIDAAAAFAKQYQASLTAVFTAPVPAVAAAGTALGGSFGTSLIAAVQTTTRGTIAGLAGQFEAVDPVIVVRGDTAPARAALAQLPATVNVGLTVTPRPVSLEQIELPPATLTITPHVVLPLPRLDPTSVAVAPVLGPLARELPAIRVAVDLVEDTLVPPTLAPVKVELVAGALVIAPLAALTVSVVPTLEPLVPPAPLTVAVGFAVEPLALPTAVLTVPVDLVPEKLTVPALTVEVGLTAGPLLIGTPAPIAVALVAGALTLPVPTPVAVELVASALVVPPLAPVTVLVIPVLGPLAPIEAIRVAVDLVEDRLAAPAVDPITVVFVAGPLVAPEIAPVPVTFVAGPLVAPGVAPVPVALLPGPLAVEAPEPVTVPVVAGPLSIPDPAPESVTVALVVGPLPLPDAISLAADIVPVLEALPVLAPTSVLVTPILGPLPALDAVQVTFVAGPLAVPAVAPVEVELVADPLEVVAPAAVQLPVIPAVADLPPLAPLAVEVVPAVATLPALPDQTIDVELVASAFTIPAPAPLPVTVEIEPAAVPLAVPDPIQVQVAAAEVPVIPPPPVVLTFAPPTLPDLTVPVAFEPGPLVAPQLPGVPVAFQPEVGNLAAQLAAATEALGPIDVKVLADLAALPPLAPLTVEVVPQVAPLPPFAPMTVDVVPVVTALPDLTAAVSVPQVVTVAAPPTVVPVAAGGVQVLELDLDITLPTGEVVVAEATVPVPSGASGKQIVKAQVQARVRA